MNHYFGITAYPMLQLCGCNQRCELNSGCGFIIQLSHCIRVPFSHTKRTALHLASSLGYIVLPDFYPTLPLVLLEHVINLTILHQNQACKSYQSILMESAIRSWNVAILGEEIEFLMIIISHQYLTTLDICLVVRSKGMHVALSLLIMPHTKSSTFANTRHLHLKQ